MTKNSIPYYSGPLMPDEFHELLKTCPLQWQMLEIKKDSGSYVFFIEQDD